MASVVIVATRYDGCKRTRDMENHWRAELYRESNKAAVQQRRC